MLPRHDDRFPFQRCCIAYGAQSTAFQDTSVQRLLQHAPSNTAIQSTGQAPAPHKAQGAPNVAPERGPDMATQDTRQAPAPHDADGASHRPKGLNGPEAATRGTGRGPAPHRSKGPDTATREPDAATRGKGQALPPPKADGASHRPKGPDAVAQSKGQAPAPQKAKGASSTQCWRTGLERGRACGTGPDDGPWDAMRHDCI